MYNCAMFFNLQGLLQNTEKQTTMLALTFCQLFFPKCITCHILSSHLPFRASVTVGLTPHNFACLTIIHADPPQFGPVWHALWQPVRCNETQKNSLTTPAATLSSFGWPARLNWVQPSNPWRKLKRVSLL